MASQDSDRTWNSEV